MEENQIFDRKPVKKQFSRIGWSFCAIIAILTSAQLLLAVLVKTFWPNGCWLTSSSTGKWLVTFIPQYVIAMPIGIFLMRKIPATPPKPVNMGTKNFIIFLPICFFLVYSGNIVGNLLSSLISGGNAQNVLDSFALDNNPIKFLFMVILAPLFEEYVCRKQLIDRTRIYGEKNAVLLSAVIFGLMHMNLFQFFYAFLLGWVFSYIYIRSGKLRYTVILHGIVNFFGSIVGPFILSQLDMELLASVTPLTPPEQALEIYQQMALGLILYFVYLMMILILFVSGLILLIKKCKQLIWLPADCQLPANDTFKIVYINTGMLVFTIITIVITIISILP